MSKKKNLGIHHVDLHVGQKLRQKRLELGITQEELAGYVNLTFQQIQKYEKGLNRVSCSKLYEFAKFLKTDIKYFFHDLDEYSYSNQDAARYGVAMHEGKGVEYEAQANDIYSEITELVKAFQNINDYRARKVVIDLAQVLMSKHKLKVSS